MTDGFVSAPLPTHKRFRNLINEPPFGRLTVVSFAGMLKTGSRRYACWNCECSCGERCAAVRGSRLTDVSTKSCGCLSVDTCIARSTTHGHSANGVRSKTYNSYSAMMQRVFDENTEYHKNYGGRGIKVCDRWLGDDGFSNFLSDLGERPVGMTLDRFPDKDGNYEPENCRWATPSEQQKNRRSNVMVEANGVTGCVSDVAKANGISKGCAFSRIKSGWSPVDAVTIPIGQKPKNADNAT